VIFSAVLLLASTVSLFSQGLVLGLDFSGGTQIEVGYKQPVKVADVRGQLENAGFEDPVVLHFGSESEGADSYAGRARSGACRANLCGTGG
jgi:preprotein translocase subunit SecF